MLIAVDVLGTLKGPRSFDIRKMIRVFQEAGHEVIVWSSEYSLARMAVEEFGLNCTYHQKWSQADVRAERERQVDIAIDDDTYQTYLGAKKFVYVHEIPRENPGAFAKELLEKAGKNE